MVGAALGFFKGVTSASGEGAGAMTAEGIIGAASGVGSAASSVGLGWWYGSTWYEMYEALTQPIQ